MSELDESMGPSSIAHLSPPPEAWGPVHSARQRLLAPIERFVHVEASSGIVLLAAAAVALIWANSPWHGLYEHVIHTPFGVSLAGRTFERDLHFWVNDGLMTIFFFVVGLEVRREIHRGELSELRRATLPLLTALGGMVVPAAIYGALNAGRTSAGGWGVPMATDIAFAVGVLALLGSRVPPALRVLLLALAVIDDIGGILVIALFYSTGLHAEGFGVLGLGLLGILWFQKAGVRSPWAYVIPGFVAWAGMYGAGIHPTLAGVVIGLLTPVRAWLGPRHFIDQAENSVHQLKDERDIGQPELLSRLDAFDFARREAISPVERLQHTLHGWVAYGIMPIFALVNAGVPVGNVRLSGENVWPFLGILLGLGVGKPVGILLLARLGASLGITRLPRGVTWPQIGLLGLAAGIGFTMSLFIAELAFEPGPQLETAKLGILVASGTAAVLAYAFGLRVLPKACAPDAAATLEEAETSTVT